MQSLVVGLGKTYRQEKATNLCETPSIRPLVNQTGYGFTYLVYFIYTYHSVDMSIDIDLYLFIYRYIEISIYISLYIYRYIYTYKL